MTTHDYSAELLAGYWAGRQGAGLRDETACGRLRLAGEERGAFLQRLTTNDVRLQPGQGAVTILTSPTARILAVLTVLAQEDSLLLLAGPGQGPAVYEALRGQIFFQDRVTIAGQGNALAQFGLLGPQAGQVLAACGLAACADLPLWAWRSAALGKAAVTVQRNEGLFGAGYTLLCPAAAGQALRSALLRGGATPLPEEAYHVLRVEAGRPAPGFELTDQVNPLEAGLRRFCDDHKGCYTGQEIIARQITYDKVTTHLVGLLVEALVAPEAKVMAEGRQAGWVSSAVHSIALQRPIALAFLRRPHHEPGMEVAVQSGDQTLAATVVALPFAQAPRI